MTDQDDQHAESEADDGWFCTDLCDHAAGVFQCEKPLHAFVGLRVADGSRHPSRCVCGLPRSAHIDGEACGNGS